MVRGPGSGSEGTRYSYAQLMGLWIRNGGSRGKAALAAAIAEAESGGWSGATSANPDGGTNVGPWQLDTKGVGAGHTVAELSNPATNAAIAVQGSKDGTDWGAWETFVTGAYKRFLSPGTTPDMSVPGGGATSAGATAQAATVAAYVPAQCIWGFPGISMPIVGNVGQFCLISKSEARTWVGLGLMAVGGLVALPALALLIAGAGMRAAGPLGGAAEKVGGALMFVPGAEGVGVTMAAAGASARRGRPARRPETRGAREDRQLEATVGEPRENLDLDVHAGAVRESAEGTRRRRAGAARSRARRAASPPASSGTAAGDTPPF